jgi:hypothetical protein
VCAPAPETVAESNRTCWLAFSKVNVAEGALYETSVTLAVQLSASVNVAVAVKPTTLMRPVLGVSALVGHVASTAAGAALSAPAAIIAPGNAPTSTINRASEAALGALPIV